MVYPDTFEGFQVNSQKDWTDFHKQEIKPKPFEDFDVDIKIDACGVCGSDVHTISGGWGDAPMPLCVGHEVVGKAVRVGPKVKNVKEGDRVGVGAQVQSCLECRQCKSDNENYCTKQVATYGQKYSDGTVAQGGYASHIRAHEYFVFQIPDNIPDELAAPMMCAGLTVWSPLVRAGVGPGKKVAIIGIGGLGHFAVLWASALGAEVYALSHSPDKKEDALKLGAKEFIVTTEKDWHKPWAFHFDFMINSADRPDTFALADYLSTLNVNCTLNHVGLPDEDMHPFKPQIFAANGCRMGASHIGSRPEMLSMLKLASEKQIKPWVETLPLSEKGCAEAVKRTHENKVHYRFTLVDFDKAFPNRK